MELIQLRYFLKTAETLNYTRAAEELFTSRQALRHTLGTLERELGQSLFYNDHNRLTLTEHGEYLRQAFQGLMETFDEQERSIKLLFQGQITLRAVFSVSLFPFHLPNLDTYLDEFLDKHPHIRLDQERLPADQVVDATEGGEVDLACVLQMPTPRPNCVCKVLRSTPVGIGSGKDSPLFERESVTLRDLTAVPLVGMGSLDRIARPLWEECERLGIRLDYRVVPNTIEALYYTQSGLASSFNTFFNANQPSAGAPGQPPRRSRLEGYDWELAALCPQGRENHFAARLLSEFLQEKYRGR